jgi:hypothetical protein
VDLYADTNALKEHTVSTFDAEKEAICNVETFVSPFKLTGRCNLQEKRRHLERH